MDRTAIQALANFLKLYVPFSKPEFYLTFEKKIASITSSITTIMIKTVTIPKNNSYTLSIPNKYIGKKIEILMYALDEVSEEKSTPPQKTMADFWGSISDATAAELHKHVEESRNGWEERLNKQF